MIPDQENSAAKDPNMNVLVILDSKKRKRQSYFQAFRSGLDALVFFLRSASENLTLRFTYEKGVETDLLELLRLCYWYYKCSNIENIGYKECELKDQLGGELPEKVKKYLDGDPFTILNLQ